MNNIQQKHIVVVLGMHRSGTSVITRGLKVLGVELGDRLIGGIPENNEKGFFEDAEINAFDNELLQELGHDWHTLTPVSADELAAPAVGEFKLRAVEILRNKLSTTNCFGLKDPRIPRLLPFWQDVFAHLQVRVSYVIACRNPMSVARSLAKRDGFDLEKGYYLWLEHMLQSLVQTANQPRIVVDYDRLMEDPTGQLQRIAQNLGLTFDSESPEFAEYHTQFLEDSLRHTRYRMEDLHLDKSAPPIVIELYKVFVELAEDAAEFDHREVVSLLRHINAQFRENYPALHYMQACDERAAALAQQVADRDGRLAQLQVAVEAQQQTLAERDGQLNGLTQAVAERDARLAELDKVVTELEDGIAAVLRAMANSEEEVHHLARILHGLEGEQGPYAGLVQALIERNHQIAGLRESVRERDERAAALAQQVAERDARLAELDKVVAELEDGIAAVLRAMSDSEEEIHHLARILHGLEGEQGPYAGLVQALIERNHQIAGLRESVRERDERAAALAQQVAERDGRLAALQAVVEVQQQTLAERDISYQQTLNLIWNSTSWRITSPIRFIGTQQKRLWRIMKLVPSAIKHGKGIKPTVGKAVRIYQAEGMTGVSRVLSTLRAPMLAQPIDVVQTSSEVADNKLVIPQIDFDETRNRFVEYQKNTPINPLVRLIAFYLPQFHPFPENDAWWGKGFTEWSNVGKALPNYVGHYQPHCPIHFGYYDLRIPEVMEEQARLAKEYGIYGFSYYFYWFAGKILMDTPLELMLANKKVDIPFCLTWANENWSRRWDGQENDVLISQKHSDDDSLAFIRHLIKFFKDERYIRIDGKPILIIYRANIIPNIAATAKIWRDEMLKHDIPGLYLISAQSFGIRSPEEFDFDASVEFPPHTVSSADIRNELELINPEYNGHIYSYEQVVANAVLNKEPNYKLYRTAMLSWDNTARKQNSSHIFHGFSLLRYKQWLSSIVNKVCFNPKYAADEKIVFVNAWNEWAEGTHLEPDRKFGYGYLQTTYDVLKHYDSLRLAKLKMARTHVRKSDYAVILHLHYEELWPDMREYLMRSISGRDFDYYVSVTSSSAIQKVLDDFPDAYIELVENRGRDILPFIRMLNVISSHNYTSVCKIHSKRSVYRDDGDNIRNAIFNSLIGSKEQVEEILLRFRNNARLGMVVPRNYLIKHNEHNMIFDKGVVRRVSSHMQIDFRYDVFPAGSMFWFSPNSLEPLLTIDDSFFEIESGLADGTCAHAIERMFCLIAKDRNYVIDTCESAN